MQVTRMKNLVDTKYIEAPPWIDQLPTISHYSEGGKSKLPFAFEKSTPQTDAVVQFVITRVLRRAQGYGFSRASKLCLKEKLGHATKVGGAHIAGPWTRIISRVLNKDCEVFGFATFPALLVEAKLLHLYNIRKQYTRIKQNLDQLMYISN